MAFQPSVSQLPSAASQCSGALISLLGSKCQGLVMLEGGRWWMSVSLAFILQKSEHLEKGL